MDSHKQPAAWLLAVSGAILYVWAPTTVLGPHVAEAHDVPGWLPVVAPLLLYGLLLTGLPRVPLARRLAGVGALCVGYVLLGLAASAIYAATELGPAGQSSVAIVWAYPAAAIVQVLAVPLVLFPLRDLLVPPRWRRRARRAGGRRTPTPPPTRPSAWDADVATVGGERLREEGYGQELTPEWRRALEPPRSAPAARTPTPTPRTSTPARQTPTPAPRTPTPPARTPRPPSVQPPPPRRLPPPGRPGIFQVAGVTPPPPAVSGPPPATPAVGEPPAAVPALADVPEAVIAAVPEVASPAPPLEPSPPAPPSPIVSAAIAPPPAPIASVPALTVSLAIVEAPPPPAVEAVPVVALTSPVVAAVLVPPPAPPESPPETPVVEPGPAPDHAEATRCIAERLRPVGRLPVTTHALMGVTLFAACSPRLAQETVIRSAFRFLTALMDTPGPQPVTQATLRSAAGAMVLTPLGPLRGGGPVIVAALPTRGSLALLELLSRRLAAELHVGAAPSVAPDFTAGPEPAPSELRPAPAPPGLEALAGAASACGTVTPVTLQDQAGRVLLYLLVPPGVDGHALGRFARDVYQVMEVDDDPGGVGPVHSIVLRLGDERVVIRPVAEAPGRSTLLVAAGGGPDRSGLARLQLERVAARLTGA